MTEEEEDLDIWIFGCCSRLDRVALYDLLLIETKLHHTSKRKRFGLLAVYIENLLYFTSRRLID